MVQFKNKFPSRLKELMQEQGISQNKLSADIGLSQPTIARWLSGQRQPSIDTLITLATYFKCSIDYLVGLCD